MIDHIERAMALRSRFTSDGRPVYNCAQAVIAAFSEELGLDPAECKKLGTFFRGGMQMGSVCGAITGSLMVLGLMGEEDPRAANVLFQRIRASHGGLVDCRELLRVNAERGGVKLEHCNAMIRECVGYVEEVLRNREQDRSALG